MKARGFHGLFASVSLERMTPRTGRTKSRRDGATLAATLAAALSILAVAGEAAWPQAAPKQPSLGLQEQQAPPPENSQPQNPQAPQAAPERADNPGLINELGKLWDKSISVLPPLKSPSETINDLNAGAKNASDALSRFASPGSMVSGRTICPIAVNGTPDCKSAADKLCQSKGYKEGKSLNTDSAQSCSAKVLIPGRARKPDDCRTDNYVTSALCQ
jgi:hypothetical protein